MRSVKEEISMRNYDAWKLDNGETPARKPEFEPDKEIDLPLTCQKCESEYWFDEFGATAGFCPHCNGHERRKSGSTDRRVIVARKAKAAFVAGLLMALAVGFASGFYLASAMAASIVEASR
jgi:ribosomal protein L44E